MKNLFRIMVVVLLLVSGSCKRWGVGLEQNVVARVGDKRLYESDIDRTLFSGMSVEDSIKLLESYVSRWVKGQLKVYEAENLFSSSQQDIDRRVEEYRNSLLTYRLDQYYVDNMVDTAFTQNDIQEYYDKHRSNFLLDRAVVRGVMVEFPAKFRQASKLKELMRSKKADAKQDFLDLCAKNDLEYRDLTQWTFFNDVLDFLPIRRDKDYSYLMKDDKVHEFAAGNRCYYVCITESVGVGSPVPMEMISATIRRIIFNSRKEAIVRTQEDSLLRRAMVGGEVELFIDKN